MLKSGGFKKNLLRVKQIADQGLGRAEKTEVLSVDLQNAEKRVELMKTVLQNLVKKLSTSLQAYNVMDNDKRMKKMPSILLAVSLLDNSQLLSEGVLSTVCHTAADGMHEMGKAQSSYELIVEKSTLEYFQNLLDTDIPALKRTKQTLKQLTLDMDAIKTKQLAANKQSTDHPSQANQTKSENLTSDLEEAENKVAACKDQYTTEMLTFLSKETEISSKIIEWMEAQSNYHRTCVDFIADMLPELKNAVDHHTTKPVYGCPLDDHLQATDREIAYVLEVCISILYHRGMEEEGLFRIAGSASRLKKLKAAFNVGTMIEMEDYITDLHVVAGALKQYIRELPEPLLTFDLFDQFMQCMRLSDRDERLTQLWTVVNKLPKSNLANVKYLIKFLAKLAEKSDINKMTPANIAIVFGPNLLWSQSEDDGTNVALSAIQNHVVETLVTHHDYFFPGDVDIVLIDNMEIISALRASDCGSLSRHDRSRLTNSLITSSEHDSVSSMAINNFDRGLSSSSNELNTSLNSNGQVTGSSDTIEKIDSLRSNERKKDKGLRLSLPSALNSAGDKLFSKLKSNSTSKLRSSQSVEKKDKPKLKDRWGMRKSLSQEKLKDVSRSEEDEDAEKLHELEEEAQEADDNQFDERKVVFKPRYTPLFEKQMDPWYSGAPDAPLADPEGDSPLFTEPPKRSFPLSRPPSSFHGDYDTAFAIASLKGDGLSYLSRVHSVVDTASKMASKTVQEPTNNNQQPCEDMLYLTQTKFESRIKAYRKSNANSNLNDAVRAPDFSVEDDHPSNPSNANDGPDRNVPTFCSSSDVSIIELESISTPYNSTSTFKPLDSKVANKSTENISTMSASEELPQPEISKSRSLQPDSINTSTVSYQNNTSAEGLSLVHSPSINRKGKKHAPPPPTSPPLRPDAPPTKPDNYVHRNESIKKPSVPPPSHAKAHRPNNPPPPCPAPPLPKSETRDNNPFDSQCVAYASTDVVIPEEPVRRSKSEDSDSSEHSSMNTTNRLELDIKQPGEALIKGHSRAKSHDFRQKVPPPIPQRTHSIPSKKTFGDSVKVTCNRAPSAEDIPTNNGSSIHSTSSTDVLTDEDSSSNTPLRGRMNSATDNTNL